MSNTTSVLVLIDRSGSMNGIMNEAIGAVNNFINSQKELEVDDEVFVTISSFDDQYDVLFDKVELSEVPEITYDMVAPRGLTALNDSIGRLVGSQHNKENKTILMIMTDGHENASKEFSTADIKKLIESKESEGWDVNFIGAGLSESVVAQMSMERGFSKMASFDKTEDGMRNYETYMTASTSCVRNS